MRFSGHDTFHCKEQWLLKGLELIGNQDSTSPFRNENAIYKLGVGKNMVRSIHYWLRSFDLIDEQNKFTEYSKYLFLGHKYKYDCYLENPSSLFLLQFLLATKRFASIYSLIFLEYFKDKVNMEFSEIQIMNFIKRILSEKQIEKFNENTIKSDFKVFIRTYVSPKKNFKTIEDDFSAPLLSLKLISDTGRKNELNQPVYKINKRVRLELSEHILAFCILDYFKGMNTIDFTDISSKIGSVLCLNIEGLEEIIGRLCSNDKRFIFKNDTGIKQLQVKDNSLFMKEDMLKEVYENG
ncbi:MAG: DUF4007 family protein [Flavobacteriaceae bacterium]|nr:DUF4007 family protein [Flavobacteriaceae bacterium]